MGQFSWSRRCLLRDGMPWFPVMGEFHFARYPRADWRREVAKMAAGGVSIAATYVFWLHHEPAQGRFDFGGGKSLRAFLEACRDEGLYVWLRIGPWCHGEARNGGFPDWLMQTGWALRSDDPRYLAAVREYWTQIAAQADGFFHHQGGPIIGVQLENEFGHCGGSGQPAHMDALLSLARELGIVAPYYTATGWGGAVIGSGDEVLPVMGAYCDAPWERSLSELPANGNYLFAHERNDVDIGRDFRAGEHLSFDPDRYPYLVCEMASGMAGTYHRRPYVTAKDIGAMSTCKLGSGASMLGYYMYHGGTNPGLGLNESRATGGNCDWPELSYDLRSAIGEYGQIRENFKEIKLLAMCLEDFGEGIAALPVTLPDALPGSAEDTATPRYAIRSDGQRGFVFVNNYQRRRTMGEQRLEIAVGDVRLPTIRLKDGDFAFYPVNMPLGGALLRSALATPLCKFGAGTFAFYADGDPQYDLAGEADILTLTREQALNAYKVGGDLVVSDAPLVKWDGKWRFIARGDVHYTVHRDGSHSESRTVKLPAGEAARVAVAPIGDGEYALDVSHAEGADDCFLRIDYEGAVGALYLDGRKVADDFYDGHVWEVGLRRFGFPARLVLKIAPLMQGDPVYLDRRPAFVDGRAQVLKRIEAQGEYWIDYEGSGGHDQQ